MFTSVFLAAFHTAYFEAVPCNLSTVTLEASVSVNGPMLIHVRLPMFVHVTEPSTVIPPTVGFHDGVLPPLRPCPSVPGTLPLITCCTFVPSQMRVC